MPFIEIPNADNLPPMELYYEDWGQGAPVVLIHGWPLDHQMWEYQSVYLASRGLRVIAYDRRGFGQSSKPWSGYDYDTLADDLKALLDALELQDVTLVGFSMGGGEVARYMSRHGGARVSKVAFVSAVTPYLLKTDDNPEGVDASTFQAMLDGLNKDRADFLNSFAKTFYGSAALGMGIAVSAAQAQWTLTMRCQPHLKPRWTVSTPSRPPISGKIWRPSTSRRWSSTETTTRRCPSPTAASGQRRCSRTPSIWSTRGHRTGCTS